MSEQQTESRAKPAPQPLRQSGGFAPHLGAGGGAAAHGPDASAAAAGSLAAAAKQAKGPVSHVAGALEAAARGESVADQAQRVTGPVKMSAATALSVAGAMAPDKAGASQKAMQTANQDPATGYHSPFVGIGLSGITNDQSGAENISTVIAGVDPKKAHGYAAYGANANSYAADSHGQQPGLDSPSAKDGKVDALNDVAAVTQYAAAAELGIAISAKGKGEGRQVQIDWAALSKMDVQADMGKLGGKIKYDNPAQSAANGEQAVLADMATRGKKPDDKGQFISLTGHSGGGQSSFYTALKLASDGYKNVSVVGVDMAMTPHEREVLETLGVNVTNITSNSNAPVVGQLKSPVGDGIRAGMGGGQNFYDLNVHRQIDTLDPSGLHSATNDPNVVSSVRFAQYLDSIGKHGQYSPEQYAQFISDTNGTGNQLKASTDKDGTFHPKTTADKDLFAAGSGKVADQRQLPGPDGNSTKFGGGATAIETVVNLLGGKPVTQAIQGVGQSIHNGFDAAGNLAQSAAGLIPQAGALVGGAVHQGADLLGSGVTATGNLVGSGLSGAGGLAQSGLAAAAGVTSSIGSATNSGLHAVGNGLSAAGSTIGNGLGHAGDTAKSWLGHVPLLGGFLGSAADKGMHLLGGGASAVGNLMGSGVDKVGDAAQWTAGKVAGAENAAGSLAHQGLDAAGSGASWLGSKLGGGITTAGSAAQSAIGGATTATGNFLGNAASGTLGAIGNGFGSAFNKLGDEAGALSRMGTAPLVHKLQGYGVDTSQIAGLSDFQSTNYSEHWKSLLSKDKSDTSKVQTIDAPGPSAASEPVHAHYAN